MKLCAKIINLRYVNIYSYSYYYNLGKSIYMNGKSDNQLTFHKCQADTLLILSMRELILTK